MGKTVKKILSPEVMKAVDQIQQTRHADQERLIQERQRNDALLVPDGNVDVTNAEAQQGRVIPRSVFVHKIRKLNPNLWYEQSRNYPLQGGLYIEDKAAPYGKRLVCGFPHDRLFEFAVRLTVPDVIPDPTIALHWQTIKKVDQQVPGWRSVLLKLILGGFITASGAEKEFQITRGRSSQKWQQAIN
jgi:hypothetical protein